MGNVKKLKLTVDDQDHEVSWSSICSVVSNDDLLIEILLRLPVVSIFVSKSVSKRWLSLITGPVSTALRCTKQEQVEPPSGIFVQRCMSRLFYDYVPFRSPILNTNTTTTVTFRCGFSKEGGAKILQSCNGLFVCSSGKQYYVYNPSSIHQFKRLPPHYRSKNYFYGMRLAFNPIKSPYYKVVFAGDKHDDDDDDDDDDDGSRYVKIQTYSSETGTWSICPHDRFPESKFLSFGKSIYWNDALHWVGHHDKHVCFKLDVEQLVLTSIPTPNDVSGSHKLFESRGCLLFVCHYTTYTNTRHGLNIYEMTMGRNKAGWSMKYVVYLDDIIKLQPDTIGGCTLLCIVLGEEEEDSFLVMETYGKVVRYNFLLNTAALWELYDRGRFRPALEGLCRGFYQLHPSFAII